MRRVDADGLRGEAMEVFESSGFEALAFSDRARVTWARVAPGGVIGGHTAPVEQLFVVTRGSGRMTSGEQWLDVSTGDVVLVERGEMHQTRSIGGMQAVIVESADLTWMGTEEA